MVFRGFGKTRAPEFPEGLVWLNSDPMTMKSLKGKPVLIDFWTYSCVNCLRTLPYLKRWHKTYAKLGLTVIGVHSPEFDFEKEEENVRRAIGDLGVEYPVVLDPDFAMWNLYANRVWPHVFLVDALGSIVFDHQGEGGAAQTEAAIQNMLRAAGVAKLPAIAPDSTGVGGVCYRTTSETYLGYLRGHIGNAHDKLPDTEEAFDDAAEHADDVPYLHGHWRIAPEFIEHTRTLAVATEYLQMSYSAFETNLVIGALDDREAIVDVTIDGAPIPASMAGADVVIDEAGKTHIHVTNHRMYSIIRADHYHRATLKLGVRSAGLKMYAFTFGGCKV